MIDYQTFCHLKRLHEIEGLNPAQVAKELNLDSRTVVRWLAQNRFQPRKNDAKASILDPFKPEIRRMIEKHSYSATQIHQHLKEIGYEGGYNTVKRYVRIIRPPRSKAFLKLAFAPGECAQVDWGTFGKVAVGQTSRRLHFFVMVLCYSRLIYVEFTVSQTMEHWLACHQNALIYFGGVPDRIMIDNLKSGVLRRLLGQPPVFHPKYQDFAAHFGFDVTACNVGKGNEKGRVESGVGYVKKNLLRGLDIHDFRQMNPQVRQWLETIANVRIHGETQKRPREMFAEEKPRLKALPAFPYDVASISQVRASSQFRVALDANRYSVPAEYAGRTLTLKAYPDRICLYDQEKLLARHERSYDRHKDFEDPDHVKPLLAQRQKARDQMIIKRFLALSPRAAEYLGALEYKRLNPLVHARKIVALSEIYNPGAVARAMDDAFEFQAFSSEYIANLLEQRARPPVTPGALHLTRGEDLLELEVKPPNLAIYQP